MRMAQALSLASQRSSLLFHHRQKRTTRFEALTADRRHLHQHTAQK